MDFSRFRVLLRGGGGRGGPERTPGGRATARGRAGRLRRSGIRRATAERCFDVWF